MPDTREDGHTVVTDRVAAHIASHLTGCLREARRNALRVDAGVTETIQRIDIAGAMFRREISRPRLFRVPAPS
jgi:hypothetical protein